MTLGADVSGAQVYASGWPIFGLMATAAEAVQLLCSSWYCCFDRTLVFECTELGQGVISRRPVRGQGTL